MDILFAPKIKKEDCSYLESLISDHHHTLKLLYPTLHITPKLHYLIHLPRQINIQVVIIVFYRYGPLVHQWTMRYEGKHRYFKQLAATIGNFTNICYSLSLRHQLYQCYLNLNTNTLPGEDLELGPSMLLDFSPIVYLLTRA